MSMKKQLFILTLAGLGLSAMATPPAKKAEANYQLDAKASTIKWHATKVTGEHYGTVQFSEGKVSVKDNTLKAAEFKMNMQSIDVTDLTGEYHDKLVGHLKSDDFFASAKFQTATIKLKSATPVKPNGKDANNYNIVADLTIKGITNEVSFPALVVINAGEVIVNADFDINRAKYDVRYGSTSFFEGLGDKAISDNFNVKVRVVSKATK